MVAVSLFHRASRFTLEDFVFVTNFGFFLCFVRIASMMLDCKPSGCVLQINKPKSFTPRNNNSNSGSSKRKVRIEFTKEQLVRSDNILWDPNAQRIVENYGLASPTYDGDKEQEDTNVDIGTSPNKQWKKPKKKKKKKKKYGSNMWGPDDNGNYNSYILVLRDAVPEFENNENEEEEESPSMIMARKMHERHNAMMYDPNSLGSKLAPFAIHSDFNDDNSLEYNLHLRDFNVAQTRRLARTSVSKINAYSKGRRSSFSIREARPVSWQGLMLLIFGIFSLILCLLLGQFWEEYDATKDGSYRKRMAEIKRRKAIEEKRRKGVSSRSGVRSGYQKSGRSNLEMKNSAGKRSY